MLSFEDFVDTQIADLDNFYFLFLLDFEDVNVFDKSSCISKLSYIVIWLQDSNFPVKIYGAFDIIFVLF